jgi:hypothetical protein
MPGVQLQSGMESGWVEAVVTRKDGTVEDYGVIAYNNKNPFKVAKWEKETLGAVTQETAIRCAKSAAPYVAGVAVAGLGLFLFRK